MLTIVNFERGVQSSLIVGDMPFGAYEISVSEATRNAIRYMKVLILPYLFIKQVTEITMFLFID